MSRQRRPQPSSTSTPSFGPVRYAPRVLVGVLSWYEIPSPPISYASACTVPGIDTAVPENGLCGAPTHLLPVQTPVAQSVPSVQASPTSHRGQLDAPPQSTADSRPFLTRSPQLGA